MLRLADNNVIKRSVEKKTDFHLLKIFPSLNRGFLEICDVGLHK